MMEPIKRDLYLSRLIERRENGMIKVITGIRRCGKSYLLFKLYYRYLVESGVDPSRILAVPLDDDEHEELRDSKLLGGLHQKPDFRRRHVVCVSGRSSALPEFRNHPQRAEPARKRRSLRNRQQLQVSVL